MDKFAAVKEIKSLRGANHHIFVEPRQLDSGIDSVQLMAAIGCSNGASRLRQWWQRAQKSPAVEKTCGVLLVKPNANRGLGVSQLLALSGEPLIQLDGKHSSKVHRIVSSNSNIHLSLEVEEVSLTGNSFGHCNVNHADEIDFLFQSVSGEVRNLKNGDVNLARQSCHLFDETHTKR